MVRVEVKDEYKGCINFKWSTITCTTVSVDFRKCPMFKIRLFSFTRLFFRLYPINVLIEAKRDYKLWARQGLVSNIWRKFRFIADHSFIILYLFIALIIGYSEGAKWELKRE